jgi:ribosomal protein L16/L10AE
MGKGKGAFDHYVAKIRPNKVLLEICIGQDGINYRRFLRLAGMKLPIKSKIV